MTQQYPWGAPQQPQQGGYPPQQGGYQQPPPGYGQPQPQYPPQQPPPGTGFPGFAGAPAPGGGEYNFGQLYQTADHTGGVLYPKGPYDAVVESSEWGRSRDGTKGQWTIIFRTTTGENAGRSKLTMTMSVSPRKNDGTENSTGMGILFRQLFALGIPIPEPVGPPGSQGFWQLGWSEQQVAQAMVGKPCQISLIQDEYEGVTRNKIRDIRPPRPGAPTDWPRTQPGQAQPGYGQPQQGVYPPQQPSYGMAPGFGQPPAQQWQQPAPQQAPGYGQQAPMPWQGQPQAPQQAPPAPGYGQPQQWQPGQVPQQPGPEQGQAPMQGQPPIPGAPAWAQPPTPGQPGMAQFTADGQGMQPGVPGAFPAANGQMQAPQQPQPQEGGAPPLPPWA